MQTAIQDDSWLRETADIILYSTGGEVTPARRFAERHLELLAPAEAELVAGRLDVLGVCNLPAAPAGFDRPLLRTARYADGVREVVAKRGGTRSAYLPAGQIKIKACRPEAATFPHWDLDDDFALQVGEIPFGVMTPEGVMREILAHCFEHHHGLPSAGRPLAIFDYRPEGAAGDASLGLSLVSHVPGDERVESFIDCGGLTLHDVIRLARRGLLAGDEVALRGLARQAFVEAKADLLIRCNFGGGFRGLLNSNIGNDVIRDGRLHSICDFDTFHLHPLPAAGDGEAIRRFTIRAYVELIKSSLPFIAWLELGEAPREAVHRALAGHYRTHSTLCQAYTRRFLERAADLGWEPRELSRSIDAAFATPIAFELLQELIPNSHTAPEVKPTSHYVPHN
jgi:hypothetical protein